MKLLYCKECGDIFNLKFIEKTCGCGMTKGMYVDQRQAISQGPAVAIGMGSGSLQKALAKAGHMEQEESTENICCDYNRKDYQKKCQIITWARPMNGPGNPNTLTYKAWENIRPQEQSTTFQEIMARMGEEE